MLGLKLNHVSKRGPRRITCLPNNYGGPQKFQPLYFVTYDNKQYQKQHQQHHHHHHRQHHHHHRHSKQQQQQTTFEVCINIFTVTGIITFAENDNCWRSDYANAINYRDIPQHIVLVLSFKHSQTWYWRSRVSFNFLQNIQPHIDIWVVFCKFKAWPVFCHRRVMFILELSEL